MTDPHATPGPGHGVRSEEDRISSARILVVGFASLAIFFLAGLAAASYLQVRQGERGPLPIPPEAGRSKIGMVEQQLFELSVRGERDRAARLERLRAFGWVDRPGGVAHIPIDRAMELVARGVRPAPARDAGAPPPPGGQP